MNQPADKVARRPGLWSTLAGATLVLDLVVPWATPHYRHLLSGLLFILLFSSQITIHATWVVLGPGKFWWRIGSIPLLLAFFQWFMLPLHPNSERPSFHFIFMAQWMLVGLVMLAMRGLGFQFRDESDLRHSALSGRQFSVSQLVGVITVVGFVAASLVRIESYEGFWVDRSSWLAVAATIVLTVPPVLAVLIPKRPMLPAFATLLVPVGLALALAAMTVPDTNDAAVLVNFFGSLTVVQLLFWTVVRFEGYRLSRRTAVDSRITGELIAESLESP